MSEVLLLSPGTCAGRRINHLSDEEISAALKRVWVSHRTKVKGQFRYERRSECQRYCIRCQQRCCGTRECCGPLTSMRLRPLFSRACKGPRGRHDEVRLAITIASSVRQAVRFFWSCRSGPGRASTAGIRVTSARPVLWPPTKADAVALLSGPHESTLVSFRVLMDPFEVRMQFLSLIRKLNASALLSSRSTFT